MIYSIIFLVLQLIPHREVGPDGTLFISDSLEVYADTLDSSAVTGTLIPDSLSDTKQDGADSLNRADSVQTTGLPDQQSQGLVYPEVKNNAFSVGEKLTFKIRYGFIRAGTAVMQVKSEQQFRDRPVYQIRTTANSAAGFSWIYNVEDVIDSYVDKEGLFSWRFDKKLREGGYKADLFVYYYPEDSLADVSYTRYKRRMRIRSQKNYKVKTPPFVLDVLAAFYYTRTQPLEVGKSIRLVNHDNKKVYNLEIKVHKKETLEVEAGTIRCILVEPMLQGEGIFKKVGSLQVWLSDDKYKIPVQMTSEVIVGHITTELEKIEGIAGPLPAMVSRND